MSHDITRQQDVMEQDDIQDTDTQHDDMTRIPDEELLQMEIPEGHDTTTTTTSNNKDKNGKKSSRKRQSATKHDKPRKKPRQEPPPPLISSQDLVTDDDIHEYHDKHDMEMGQTMGKQPKLKLSTVERSGPSQLPPPQTGNKNRKLLIGLMLKCP